MDDPETNIEDLQASLNALASRGISADRRRLKEDMTLQFTNHREWIREYVTNAYDANAAHVWITGREHDATLTIEVRDDGHGMDRQGILDFMTLYRSRKTAGEAAIGRHGIGKLSAAAIPGQSGFSLVTSTGQQCWRLSTGCLLDDQPIRLERVEPVPSRGTRFEITFAKANSLQKELVELRKVLDRYVRYLPLQILIASPSPNGKLPYVPINVDWCASLGLSGRLYQFDVGTMCFELALGIGRGEHAIYQNRVLVSTRYNLLSADLDKPLVVPFLDVRLDSPDFELPFGRHALRNDNVLKPVSEHLRCEVLPTYLQEVFGHQPHGYYTERQAIALALISHDPSPGTCWSRIPLFRDVFLQQHSAEDLRNALQTHGALYLQGKDAVGVDYRVFDSPVLACNQPKGALTILQRLFQRELINLGVENLVLEAPQSASRLGPLERRFERHLEFHPLAFAQREPSDRQQDSPAVEAARSALSKRQVKRQLGLCEEALESEEDLESLTWRVSYLVGPDGVTPALTHRFLHNGTDVVLNLHHPEVRQLLQLSEQAPALAGHWGLAMVLADPQRSVLKHLSAEAREDLIIADALAKCDAPALDDDEVEIEELPDRERQLWNLISNMADDLLDIE